MISHQTDVLIIGAGIAGASIAWHLLGRTNVILLDQEAHAGYHTTGRSAAFYAELYGGPDIQPLTTASKEFLFHPPAGFSDAPLVSPRGAIYAAREKQLPVLDQMHDDFRQITPELRFLVQAERDGLLPMMKPLWKAAALYDPVCRDLNVAAIHAGFLRGQTLHLNARVLKIERQAGMWHVECTMGSYQAKTLVNAAGAWGDEIAARAGVAPIGLQPRRRTIIAFTPVGEKVDPHAPLVLDADEEFYFKPEGVDIWASPADETLMPACDVQPDEIDIAITVDRIERATNYKIETIKRKWAGLRTFAPDRLPVYGFDPHVPGFFWCVGQGGWGIQTAPAAGQLCAALILNEDIPGHLARHGITADRYARRSAEPT
jgi:D-arginine dehydrogenase